MPFCCQCGKPVSPRDVYCGACGTKQSTAPGGRQGPFADMSPRTASLLCYIPFAGWIAAIIVLASQRFQHDRTVRFHAFQGLYLFVAWLIVDWALSPMLRLASRGTHFGLGGLAELAVLGAWIFMLVKTSQNVVYRLPVIGELAERSLAEQQ